MKYNIKITPWGEEYKYITIFGITIAWGNYYEYLEKNNEINIQLSYDYIVGCWCYHRTRILEHIICFSNSFLCLVSCYWTYYYKVWPAMNEMIKELADQADISWLLEHHPKLEKFAELIVRECVEQVEQAKNSPFVSLDDAKRMQHFVNVTKKKITKHLGVGE